VDTDTPGALPAAANHIAELTNSGWRAWGGLPGGGINGPVVAMARFDGG
jgi:hypothetical protein